MSSYLRVVLADVTVSWDGGTLFVKRGTVAAIVPGSRLEAAYGGASNLSAVVTRVSPEAASTFSRAALGN